MSQIKLSNYYIKNTVKLALNEDLYPSGDITSSLVKNNKVNKRIMIAGGGNVGKHLSESISSNYQVKVIESNEERANHLSEVVDDVTVISADSSNEDVLLEENIEHMDVFCALTNDDEANILSAMLAKKLGAKTVISIINKISYSDLVEKIKQAI